MNRAIRIIAFTGDAGWFLFGLAMWLLFLGAGTVHVSSATSKHSFTFKGWS